MEQYNTKCELHVSNTFTCQVSNLMNEPITPNAFCEKINKVNVQTFQLAVGCMSENNNDIILDTSRCKMNYHFGSHSLSRSSFLSIGASKALAITDAEWMEMEESANERSNIKLSL